MGGPCTYPLDTDQIDERGVPITVNSGLSEEVKRLSSFPGLASLFSSSSPHELSCGPGETDQEKKRREKRPEEASQRSAGGMACAAAVSRGVARENRQGSSEVDLAANGRKGAHFGICVPRSGKRAREEPREEEWRSRIGKSRTGVIDRGELVASSVRPPHPHPDLKAVVCTVPLCSYRSSCLSVESGHSCLLKMRTPQSDRQPEISNEREKPISSRCRRVCVRARI